MGIILGDTTFRPWADRPTLGRGHDSDRGAILGKSLYAARMSAPLQAIARGLELVRELRTARDRDPDLAARVHHIKQYQNRRFERDYVGLLASPRYGVAARFFLNDLYGPTDFSARDAQFSRIVPTLALVLPKEVVLTVRQVIELHALSEELDQQMAHAVGLGPVGDPAYQRAWRQVARRADRNRQVNLMLAVGRALDAHTRNPLLGVTLRLMRGPARLAGLGQLHEFLEAGFSAFAAMRGAQEFLDTVARNELARIDKLFDG
jgi:hypothetical protein